MKDLFQSVRLNDKDVYKDLIQQVDVNITNEYNQNLLHEAIAFNNTEIGIDLINRRIDVNHKDYEGFTPLHFAAYYYNFIIAEAIFKNGGNPNIKNKYNNNALWVATFNARGRYELVTLYRKNGGDPHAKNGIGKSAVDFARQIGDEILLSILETDGNMRKYISSV